MPLAVLMVEDEPLIRMVAADAVRDLGFEVEEAGCAADVDALVAQSPDGFAAAIVDIGLPDRPGDMVAMELRARWPMLPIIIASGHDPAALTERFASDRHLRVIGKPYSDHALPDALRAMGIVAG